MLFLLCSAGAGLLAIAVVTHANKRRVSESSHPLKGSVAQRIKMFSHFAENASASKEVGMVGYRRAGEDGMGIVVV